MSDKSPGLAILMMHKGKHDEPDGDEGGDEEGMSDGELDGARMDALMAHDEAHESGDHDGRLDALYQLHKLHHEKRRREQGE